MATFNPAFPPSVSGISKKVQTRSLVADFGDGYTQRAGDGLNGIKRSVSLSWNGLTVAEADAIEAFFVTHKGYISFDWTAPRDSAPRKWICKEWERPVIDSGLDMLSATFEEVFDL